MSKLLIGVKEVSEIMDCSDRHAYKVIKQLNEELESKGYIIRSGRVPRKYFFQRTGLEEVGA